LLLSFALCAPPEGAGAFRPLKSPARLRRLQPRTDIYRIIRSDRNRTKCQGTSSLVPKRAQKNRGFNPCANKTEGAVAFRPLNLPARTRGLQPRTLCPPHVCHPERSAFQRSRRTRFCFSLCIRAWLQPCRKDASKTGVLTPARLPSQRHRPKRPLRPHNHRSL